MFSEENTIVKINMDIVKILLDFIFFFFEKAKVQKNNIGIWNIVVFLRIKKESV